MISRMRNFGRNALGHMVLATGLIDSAYRRFDRLRSNMVVALGSDAFFDKFNDIAYGRPPAYQMATKGLFPFERRAIASHFPPPPASILIGAAGSGREALVLAEQGYRIVAFEPIRAVIADLAKKRSAQPIECLYGRYEALPILETITEQLGQVDLRSRAPFAAAILSSGSISHLRSDKDCIATLSKFKELTPGPILISWFPYSGGPKRRFNLQTGLYRPFTGTDVRRFAEACGLEVLHLDDEDHWHAVLRRAS